MRDIDSILLTYENKNRLEFQYCAEFFRLLGVYVCENLRDADGNEEINCEKYLFTRRYYIKGKEDKKLVDYLKDILEEEFGADSLSGWLGALVLLYDGMHLMQESVVLQYYYKRKQEKCVLQAGMRFKELADKLISIEQTYPESINNRHFLYAKLYCKQKANFAKYYYNESYEYYIDELVEEGVGIIRKFLDFSNVWVLLGLIYEASDRYSRESEDAFLQGISMIGDVPYAASVLYWLGRLYEKNDFLVSAEEAYRKANKLSVRYRNEYKVAISEYSHNNWEEALSHFQKCIKLLRRKDTYWDSLEIEYYFKICIQMSAIYLKMKDYRNAIVRAISALDLRNDVLVGSNTLNGYARFCGDLFGNDAKSYIDLTIKNMKPKTAYLYLAEACEEIGLAKDAEKFWRFYKEWI